MSLPVRPLAIIGAAVLLALVACMSSAPRPDADYPSAAVLYVANAPHDVQLYAADGDGNNFRPLLADPGYDYNPSLSADGQWVIFTSEREGSADIYRVRIDGSGLERLTDHRAFDDRGVLSPDGKSLAFVSTRAGGNANIWLLDLGSRKLTNLTAGSPGDFHPTWSPDSRWIAFSSIRESTPLRAGDDPAAAARRFTTSNFYVIGRDGSGLRRITSSGSAFSPRWSQNGRTIAGIDLAGLAELADAMYSSDRAARAAVMSRLVSKVISVDVADGRVRDLAQVPGIGSASSPQSVATRAAFATPQGVRFSDGVAGARGEFASPSWSADATTMVFHRRQPSPQPSPQSAPPMGSPTAFTLRTGLDPNFRVLRTGQFPSHLPLQGSADIVANNLAEGPGYLAILAVSSDGAHSREIFNDPQRAAIAPAVSPDGEEIAFGYGAKGFVSLGAESRLALVSSHGGTPRELTSAGEHAAYPSWSPDGTKLVYVHGAPGERGLRILDVGSGRVSTVTTGDDNFPAWSPDGARIAFTRSPHGLEGASQIYTVKPDGSNLVRLTLSPGAQDAHPAWSPDGRWIAFTSARVNPRDEMIGAFSAHHGVGQIFVMRADGTDVRQLTDTPYESGTPAWH